MTATCSQRPYSSHSLRSTTFYLGTSRAEAVLRLLVTSWNPWVLSAFSCKSDKSDTLSVPCACSNRYFRGNGAVAVSKPSSHETYSFQALAASTLTSANCLSARGVGVTQNLGSLEAAQGFNNNKGGMVCQSATESSQ